MYGERVTRSGRQGRIISGAAAHITPTHPAVEECFKCCVLVFSVTSSRRDGPGLESYTLSRTESTFATREMYRGLRDLNLHLKVR